MEHRNFKRILAYRNILSNSRVAICVISILIFLFFDDQLSNESIMKDIQQPCSRKTNPTRYYFQTTTTKAEAHTPLAIRLKTTRNTSS